MSFSPQLAKQFSDAVYSDITKLIKSRGKNEDVSEQIDEQLNILKIVAEKTQEQKKKKKRSKKRKVSAVEGTINEQAVGDASSEEPAVEPPVKVVHSK